MIRRTTWILIAVFVALLALAWYLQRGGGLDEGGTPTPVPVFLLEDRGGTLTRLRLENRQGEAISVEYRGDQGWQVEGYAVEETDQARVDTALQTIERLTVVRTLESGLEPETIGLEDPAFILRVRTPDGAEQTIQVGAETPVGEGYYVRRDGGPIQIVSQVSLAPVLQWLQTPPVLATPIPQPTPSGE